MILQEWRFRWPPSHKVPTLPRGAESLPGESWLRNPEGLVFGVLVWVLFFFYIIKWLFPLLLK